MGYGFTLEGEVMFCHSTDESSYDIGVGSTNETKKWESQDPAEGARGHRTSKWNLRQLGLELKLASF